MKDFYYHSSSKQLEKSIRRTIGMYLFKLRQQRNLTAEKVCKELGVKVRLLDKIEIGKGCTRWNYIQCLLDYYGVHFKFDLDVYSKQQK